MSLHELGLAEAARAIRRKEVSPVELVEALIERAGRVDGRVQAWALLDADGARAAARRAADDAARGALREPLHGRQRHVHGGAVARGRRLVRRRARARARPGPGGVRP